MHVIYLGSDGREPEEERRRKARIRENEEVKKVSYELPLWETEDESQHGYSEEQLRIHVRIILWNNSVGIYQ